MLKNLIRSFIVPWDRFMCKINKIQPITGSSYSLLCIKTTKYKGRNLKLSDDYVLNKGDIIIEIHLSNVILAKGTVGTAAVASDLQLFPYVRAELFLLGKYLRSQNLHTNIKAVGGVTVHGPSLRRFGFTLYPGQKNFSDALVSIWMRILQWAFSRPKEVVRAKKHPPRHLEHFYMPTSQFLQKYGV